MRDYGVVSPRFWIGTTGKALRGNAPAQVLAMYLMTSPHANMIGVFHCPLIYMAHETGLGMEGASKALQSLIEAEFCTYEESSETVFVHRMAAFQIGDQLSAQDKRCKGVEREWNNIPSAQLQQAFFAIYSGAFHLPKQGKKARPTEAPSKALRSQEQEQEQEQEERDAGAPAAPAKPSRVSRGDKTLKTYIDECKAAGVKPIPDGHYVRTYLRDAGITEDMAALAWVRFREDHTVGTRKGKRYTDWPAVFANSVKDRWYRLWTVNPEGDASWTNEGLQARRVADAQQREEVPA